MNIGTLTSHRAAFINHLVGGTIWGIFSLSVMVILTNNVKAIFTWSKGDILLLSGILAILLGLFNTFFQGNFDEFPSLVNKGKIDSFLLKPIDAQVALSVWKIKIISLSRALLGIVFVIYVVMRYDIHISFLGVLMLVPFFILGLSLYYSIWSIVTTLTIWFDRATNIVEVLHSLQSVMRIPPVVFQEISTILFVIVFPLTVIVAVPVEVALGKSSFNDILLLFVVTVGLCYLCRRFWLLALRSYTGASS